MLLLLMVGEDNLLLSVSQSVWLLLPQLCMVQGVPVLPENSDNLLEK